MPNLLKSLPREILEQEDAKFIYNVLNPLLFEKIPESSSIFTKTFGVDDLILNSIYGEKNNSLFIPYNVDSRELHVYMDNTQSKRKVERYSNTNLINSLNDLQDYIYHYFSQDGYWFLKSILERAGRCKVHL